MSCEKKDQTVNEIHARNLDLANEHAIRLARGELDHFGSVMEASRVRRGEELPENVVSFIGAKVLQKMKDIAA
jgi:hypothetical protein